MTIHLKPKLVALDPTEFDVRLLDGSVSDTTAYRALRNKIRHSEGARNFADSYTREDGLSEPLWREWCAAKREHCIVGVLDKKKENKLASIMMITAQGPKDSLVAEWEATWVEPEYRGSGVAKRAYEEVHRITRDLGYQHAVVFIRDDNYHSRTIREAQGFTYLRTKKDEHWADGSVANTNLFILDLFPDCPIDENPYERALCRLEATLESLKNEAPFIEDAIKDKIAGLRNEKTEFIHTTRFTSPKIANG